MQSFISKMKIFLLAYVSLQGSLAINYLKILHSIFYGQFLWVTNTINNLNRLQSFFNQLAITLQDVLTEPVAVLLNVSLQSFNVITTSRPISTRSGHYLNRFLLTTRNKTLETCYEFPIFQTENLNS